MSKNILLLKIYISFLTFRAFLLDESSRNVVRFYLSNAKIYLSDCSEASSIKSKKEYLDDAKVQLEFAKAIF